MQRFIKRRKWFLLINRYQVSNFSLPGKSNIKISLFIAYSPPSSLEIRVHDSSPDLVVNWLVPFDPRSGLLNHYHKSLWSNDSRNCRVPNHKTPRLYKKQSEDLQSPLGSTLLVCFVFLKGCCLEYVRSSLTLCIRRWTRFADSLSGWKEIMKIGLIILRTIVNQYDYNMKLAGSDNI